MILSQYGHVAEVLEATNIHDALNVDNGSKIDLILLDLEMPLVSGIDGIEILLRKFAKTPIVILSAEMNEARVKEAKLKGASGFLHKSATSDEILAAINTVLNGGQYFGVATALGAKGTPNQTPDLSNNLTNRQREVLAAMAEGLSNKVIARQLALSENTVRVHVSAILAALGAGNRTEATFIAQRQGLIG